MRGRGQEQGEEKEEGGTEGKEGRSVQQRR